MLYYPQCSCCNPLHQLSLSLMAIPAAVAVIPIGVLFLSGLIVNIIQATFFITVRPFSRNMYRRINRVVVELLWLQPIWLAHWCTGIEVRLYADTESFKSLGKEHALVVCNHKSDIDWLVGWILAQRSGCLGSALGVTKKSSKFLPVIGWSMWFTEFLFLERSWSKDEISLKSGMQRLEDYPQPFWLALFVEGTRFTQAKLLAAQEYAISQGLPIPRNVLIPRTKGFVSAVNIMRSYVPAVYDLTLSVPRDQPFPTILRLLRGQPSVVHVHMKRHSMNDLPRSDEGVAQWCRESFMAKDSLLDKHLAENTFGESDYKPIGRPMKSFLVVVFWSGLLSFAALKWRGFTFVALCLILVIGLMHFLVVFSQSERSTTAKAAARSRTKEE